MAVTIIQKPAKSETSPSPWEGSNAVVTPDCVNAMNAWMNGKKGNLFLSNISTGAAYQVLGWDPETRIVKLVNADGGEFAPVFTDREERQYKPVWRD